MFGLLSCATCICCFDWCHSTCIFLWGTVGPFNAHTHWVVITQWSAYSSPGAVLKPVLRMHSIPGSVSWLHQEAARHSPPSHAQSYTSWNPLGLPMTVIYFPEFRWVASCLCPPLSSVQIEAIAASASQATELFHIRLLYGTQHTVTLGKYHYLD